jgi:hypothetical protein
MPWNFEDYVVQSPTRFEEYQQWKVSVAMPVQRDRGDGGGAAVVAHAERRHTAGDVHGGDSRLHVCVYGSSSAFTPKKYLEAAYEMGRLLAVGNRELHPQTHLDLTRVNIAPTPHMYAARQAEAWGGW